jgi:hypothetical protein
MPFKVIQSHSAKLVQSRVLGEHNKEKLESLVITVAIYILEDEITEDEAGTEARTKGRSLRFLA